MTVATGQRGVDGNERARGMLVDAAGWAVHAAARRCAAEGWRRVAVFGAGQVARCFVRRPWVDHGVSVVAFVDDFSEERLVRGVPVVRADELEKVDGGVDVVMVCSVMSDGVLMERARECAGRYGLPVVNVFEGGGMGGVGYGEEETVERLVEVCGVGAEDARWLVANRYERHDATLPMLPAERTELHIRRYEFAWGVMCDRLGQERARAIHVFDAASGTGYGSGLLGKMGAREVVGVELDERAVGYAQRRHGGDGVRFVRADATATGLDGGGHGGGVSFETIEHVPDAGALLDECGRLLGDDGVLVLSTPNDKGLTDFHVHSFTREDLEGLVRGRFREVAVYAQRGDVGGYGPEGAGIEPARQGEDEGVECFLVVAQGPKR